MLWEVSKSDAQNERTLESRGGDVCWYISSYVVTCSEHGCTTHSCSCKHCTEPVTELTKLESSTHQCGSAVEHTHRTVRSVGLGYETDTSEREKNL